MGETPNCASVAVCVCHSLCIIWLTILCDTQAHCAIFGLKAKKMRRKNKGAFDMENHICFTGKVKALAGSLVCRAEAQALQERITVIVTPPC